MNTAVCAIACQENLYIREFVEHYKKLGFTNIILFDNNDIDGEYFDEVIEDYINTGFVILKNYRGIRPSDSLANVQTNAYNLCYQEYGNKYDWIGFFDIDELLILEKHNMINELLSLPIYDKADCIRINWKCFDDNGIIQVKNNDYSMLNRFTNVLPKEHIKNYAVKSIIRGGLNNIKFNNNAHGVYNMKLYAVDVHGNKCENKTYNEKNVIWDTMWLNHYKWKTIEEFIRIKLVRKYPDGNSKKLNIDKFFEFDFNKKTPEKIEFAQKLIKKLNIKL